MQVLRAEPQGAPSGPFPSTWDTASVLERAEPKSVCRRESCQPFPFHSEITLNPYPDRTEEDWGLTESLRPGVRI